MTSKLVNVPEHKLDEILISKLKVSSSALFIVSFILDSGLKLIIDQLQKYTSLKDNRLVIITSNYMKVTQPKALDLLLSLKNLGAEVYVFDSLESNKSFHIKGYYFESSNSKCCILGSSNISRTAFRLGFEFNVEISDKDFLNEFLSQCNGILNNPLTKELTKEFIQEYSLVYEENNNPFTETTEIIPELETLQESSYIEPNIVQKEALEILASNRKLGIKKGLVVMATGLGKTILSALDVKEFNPNRMLFIAHRKEILEQAFDSFRNFFSEKTFGYYGSGEKQITSEFLFAMIQTIGKEKELLKFSPDHFDYIVIDEFHHVGAPSYRRLVEYFNPDFFLGLTATPNRSDNIDILSFCGNNLIYKKDLIDGINLDLLCNFEYQGINDKYVDYTKISWRGNKFDEQELSESLSTNKRASYVFDNWNLHKQTRTLAFCSSISHCDFMTFYFQSKNINAVSVHSKSEVHRDKAIKMLKEGEIDILFSVDLFNEGVDIPQVDTIMMLRPTESKILFIQQLGRGLRTSPNTGKELVKIIDFIGNHKSFLEKPAALFDFDLNAKNIKEFTENYKNHTLPIPKKSRIYFDPEILDFYEKLISQSMSYVDKYIEYKSENALRPTALQFHQFIGKLALIRSDYGSWFNFINHMRDIPHKGLHCLSSNEKFLKYLEITKMTRSFKMVLLQVFLENGMEKISIDDLSVRSYNFLNENMSLSNDIPSKFRFEETINGNNEWKKYWLDNPINALIGGNLQGNESVYFQVKDNYFSCNFNVTGEDKKQLIEMSQEIVDYRLFSYKPKYDASSIEMADLSKSYNSQIGKSIRKIDTPIFFNATGKAAKVGCYKMTGHAMPPGFNGQFIYITLVKSELEKDHRYHDFFKSDKHFSWQSKKQVHQDHKQCLSLVESKEINKPIHLLVRKHKSNQGKALPFTYCGEIEVIDVSGNNPVNVNFRLKVPLSKKLVQDFMQI